MHCGRVAGSLLIAGYHPNCLLQVITTCCSPIYYFQFSYSLFLPASFYFPLFSPFQRISFLLYHTVLSSDLWFTQPLWQSPLLRYIYTKHYNKQGSKWKIEIAPVHTNWIFLMCIQTAWAVLKSVRRLCFSPRRHKLCPISNAAVFKVLISNLTGQHGCSI